MKNIFAALSLTLLLTACTDSSTTSAKSSTPVNVTVLGLNDFHGNLEATNFKIPDPADATKLVNLPAGGAELIGGYVQQEKDKNANQIFVGAGDLIGASPVTSSLLRDEPTVLALSKMGMKFSSLGNHEFDQGLKELQRMQKGGCDSNAPEKACKFQNPYPGATFKWLGANVVDKTTRKTVFDPYDIATVGGVKIGFIGAVLKDTPSIVSPDGIATLDFLDEADSINKYVTELKGKGVDAIIVLIHQGGTAKDGYAVPACGTLTGPIVDIVNRLDPAVNAVISGHTHQGYNCLVNGRTVIEGDFYGHLLQRLDLTITPSTKKVEVRAMNVLMDSRTLPKDPAMTTLVTRAKDLTNAVRQSPVGTIATASITKTNNAAGESALGDVVADSMLASTGAQNTQIAFMNPGGLRADLIASGAGNSVTYGDLYAVQPFGNNMTVMDLTGAQIRAVLEEQFDSGGTVGANKVLQISKGLTYSYDSTAAKGSRVDASSLKLNGAVLDPAKNYRIVTNSFLAGGGDSFSTFKSGTNVLQLPNLVDIDVFVAYVKANPGLAGGAQNRITKTK
ncbi:bifunctional UDP-sugar hydrolase/5'-nucleotidase [Deinococcus sp.]|uniref:bifunctional metallophosphatase/5'-nucleotidase n=1 Tax=Deinococcus sp. TaxID=47478 RepID=UPI0025B96905|nr:bifunctional metallophosphatase/5'-nucleotidase [Deinococcus sp.]